MRVICSSLVLLIICLVHGGHLALAEGKGLVSKSKDDFVKG